MMVPIVAGLTGGGDSSQDKHNDGAIVAGPRLLLQPKPAEPTLKQPSQGGAGVCEVRDRLSSQGFAYGSGAGVDV